MRHGRVNDLRDRILRVQLKFADTNYLKIVVKPCEKDAQRSCSEALGGTPDP